MYWEEDERVLVREGKGNVVSAIARSRYSAPILVVEPRSKNGMSVVQRDRRVDGVLLTYRTDHKLVTRNFLQAIKKSQKYIELDISPLLRKEKASSLRKLLLLTREFNATRTRVLPIVGDEFDRKHRDLRSVLVVLGINWELSDRRFIDDLVITNRKKLEGKYFHDGIEVVE